MKNVRILATLSLLLLIGGMGTAFGVLETKSYYADVPGYVLGDLPSVPPGQFSGPSSPLSPLEPEKQRAINEKRLFHLKRQFEIQEQQPSGWFGGGTQLLGDLSAMVPRFEDVATELRYGAQSTMRRVYPKGPSEMETVESLAAQARQLRGSAVPFAGPVSGPSPLEAFTGPTGIEGTQEAVMFTPALPQSELKKEFQAFQSQYKLRQPRLAREWLAERVLSEREVMGITPKGQEVPAVETVYRREFHKQTPGVEEVEVTPLPTRKRVVATREGWIEPLGYVRSWREPTPGEIARYEDPSRIFGPVLEVQRKAAEDWRAKPEQRPAPYRSEFVPYKKMYDSKEVERGYAYHTFRDPALPRKKVDPFEEWKQFADWDPLRKGPRDPREDVMFQRPERRPMFDPKVTEVIREERPKFAITDPTKLRILRTLRPEGTVLDKELISMQPAVVRGMRSRSMRDLRSGSRAGGLMRRGSLSGIARRARMQQRRRSALW